MPRKRCHLSSLDCDSPFVRSAEEEGEYEEEVQEEEP